jgi:hypothetical protein
VSGEPEGKGVGVETGKIPYALVVVGDGKVFVDTYDRFGRHDGELICLLKGFKYEGCQMTTLYHSPLCNNARNIHFDSWIHGGIRIGTVMFLAWAIDRPTRFHVGGKQ